MILTFLLSCLQLPNFGNALFMIFRTSFGFALLITSYTASSVTLLSVVVDAWSMFIERLISP